jgi:nitrogen fixation NifU-like protein
MVNNNGYDDKLLKHFLNPQNSGVLLHNDAYARVQNPVNGYTTDLYLKIKDKKITDIRFKTYGCTVTIAAGSAITIILKDKQIDDIIFNSDPIRYLEDSLIKELGEIPDKNWHCIPTIIKSVFSAFYNYFDKTNNNNYMHHLEKLIQQIDTKIEKKLHS